MTKDSRSAVLKMIGEVNGGMTVAAAFLGMTPAALHNRAYLVKGQAVRTEHALALQALSGTTHFADEVALASGGIFVKLPDDLECADDMLQAKFHELYTRLGKFSERYAKATEDGEIDAVERVDLQKLAHAMHKTIGELLALSFRIYCRNGGEQ
ncbi:MAG: YmfL family putative regulatory protein [Pseudomonadota bacterium]